MLNINPVKKKISSKSLFLKQSRTQHDLSSNMNPFVLHLRLIKILAANHSRGRIITGFSEKQTNWLEKSKQNNKKDDRTVLITIVVDLPFLID